MPCPAVHVAASYGRGYWVGVTLASKRGHERGVVRRGRGRGRLWAAGGGAAKLLYADGWDLGHASAGDGGGRVGRRGGRRGADVLAVDVLGIADKCGALLPARVALLEAVEL